VDDVFSVEATAPLGSEMDASGTGFRFLSLMYFSKSLKWNLTIYKTQKQYYDNISTYFKVRILSGFYLGFFITVAQKSNLSVLCFKTIYK